MTEEIIIENAFHLCQRLEQENKALKQEIDDLLNKNPDCNDEFGCQELIELKKENKELKSNVLKWQKAFSRQYQINENKGYSKAEENYRSALEEIREIVNEPCIEDEDCETCDSNCMCKEILNKINEVLNNESN